MKYLFILNDPPYGTERSYNGIRHARELLKNQEAGNEVRVFLIGDAAACAKSGQKVPQGYYNIRCSFVTAPTPPCAAPALTPAGLPIPIS